MRRGRLSLARSWCWVTRASRFQLKALDHPRLSPARQSFHLPLRGGTALERLQPAAMERRGGGATTAAPLRALLHAHQLPLCLRPTAGGAPQLVAALLKGLQWRRSRAERQPCGGDGRSWPLASCAPRRASVSRGGCCWGACWRPSLRPGRLEQGSRWREASKTEVAKARNELPKCPQPSIR